MKKRLLLIVCCCIITTTVHSCKKKEDTGPSISVMSNPPSEGSDTLGEGRFTSYDHDLSGTAILYKEATTGLKKLRLSDYNMTAGPDVHVYLSKTSSYSAANVIELQKLSTGYSNSSITLDVTSSNYSADYKYVLVYCVQYSSLFGYVELK